MSEDSGEPRRKSIPVCEVVKDPCPHGFFIGVLLGFYWGFIGVLGGFYRWRSPALGA
jgi:hypothetical protein